MMWEVTITVLTEAKTAAEAMDVSLRVVGDAVHVRHPGPWMVTARKVEEADVVPQEITDGT